MAYAERIVIVGAGFGGLATALFLARMAPEKEVVLIDRSEFHFYTPWLYEVASAFLGHSSLELRLRTLSTIPLKKIVQLARLSNLRFKHQEVGSIDFSQKTISFLNEQTIVYDRLVLSLGLETFYGGVEGADQYAYSFYLLNDVMELRKRMKDLLTRKEAFSLSVIGGGAVGVEYICELACAFRKAGLQERVSLRLIDLFPEVLFRFPTRMRRRATARLRSLGVELCMDTAVHKVSREAIVLGPRPRQPDELTLTSPFKEDVELSSSLVVWAAGARPNSLLSAMNLPLDDKGRLKVLPQLQVEGHPDVFALGDSISILSEARPRVHQASAWIALRQARYLARYLSGKRSGVFLSAKSAPAIVTLGAMHGTSTFFGRSFSGFGIFILRRFVDLNYLRKILPFFEAFKLWVEAVRLFSKNDFYGIKATTTKER